MIKSRKFIIFIIIFALLAISLTIVGCNKTDNVDEISDIIHTVDIVDESGSSICIVTINVKENGVKFFYVEQNGVKATIDEDYRLFVTFGDRAVYSWVNEDKKLIVDGGKLNISLISDIVNNQENSASFTLKVQPYAYYTSIVYQNKELIKAVYDQALPDITVKQTKPYYDFIGYTIKTSDVGEIKTRDGGLIWRSKDKVITDVTAEFEPTPISIAIDYGAAEQATIENLPETITIESSFGFLKPLTLTGYTFEGWYSDGYTTCLMDAQGRAQIKNLGDNASQYGVKKTDNGYQLNILAKWTINKYNVSYYHNDALVRKDICAYNETITLKNDFGGDFADNCGKLQFVINGKDYTEGSSYTIATNDVDVRMITKNHTVVIDKGQAPTCTVDGKKDGSHCSECYKVLVPQETIPALTHDYVAVVTPPSCTEKGYTTYTCSRCNDRYVGDNVNELGHTYDNWTITTAATCTSDGEEIGCCVRCQSTQTRTVSALGHDYIPTVTPPTCTEGGYTTYTCSRCNDRYVGDNVKALGHTYDNWTITTAATCTSDGEETGYCIRCQSTQTRTVSALGHDYIPTVTSPTCAEGGYTTYICARCNDRYVDDYVNALGHDHVTSVVSPTCTEDGYTDHVCSRCGDNYQTDLVKALGHNYVECVCARCGKAVHGIKDGAYCRHGTTLYFGEYPQTIKAENVSITSSMDSRGYYLGSDGDYYAKVTATPYENLYAFSTGATIENGAVYYFKVEPIRWKVLTEKDGAAFIVCDNIIETHKYDASANDYENSEIRAWLNDTFYKAAFKTAQQKLIEITEVDNSARSANPALDPTAFNDGSNQYACSNTYDKIFLLSLQEVTAVYNENGFDTSYDNDDSLRSRQTVDYARACGAEMSKYTDYYGNGSWWLRSPSYDEVGYVYGVYHYGDGKKYAVSSDFGVVPALTIRLCEHVFGDWNVVDVTCTEDGYKTRVCTKCGKIEKQITDVATGHNFVDCVCTKCGKASHGVKDGAFCRHDEIIYFGSYPQTLVDDPSLIDVLTSSAGTLPTETNAKKWKSYDYYIESEIRKYMWYVDLESDGEKYRGVYFTEYRPNYTSYTSNANNSYQDNYGYTTGNVYWFRYEPVKWRILSESNGEAFLFSEMIVDSQSYNNTLSNDKFSHNGGTGYENNYALSDIRKWLNSTFYNTAFNDLQKELILITTVDNSSNSTSDARNQTARETASVCDDTEDHIFLLSMKEATTSEYGFSTDYSSGIAARRKKITDYAKSQGAFESSSSSGKGYGRWWLRSPKSEYVGASFAQYNVRIGEEDGKVANWSSVNKTSCGVVPALRVRICDHVFGNWNLVEATCTEAGYRTGTCTKCGKVIVEPTDSATGHNYVDCVCTKCGKISHMGEDGTYCRHEDYIYFGSYPQSEVTDESITSSLQSLAGSLPTNSNSGKWTSYNYYIDSDNSQDYMWYIDLHFEGEQYRGVYFTSYRPYDTKSANELEINSQEINGYLTGKAYWFCYEPIKWRILSETNGELLIFAEMALDSQEFCHFTTEGKFAHNGGAGYANNYALSGIRKWLNENFYNTTFNDLQKQFIVLTTVDNSERSTNPDCNAEEINYGENNYACADTSDRIFLVSTQEITDALNGFKYDYRYCDVLRRKQSSDYAKSQGGYINTDDDYMNNTNWWLRSPVFLSGTLIQIVDYTGDSGYGAMSSYTCYGIVPALRVNFCIDGHTYDNNCVCTACGTVSHNIVNCICTVCGAMDYNDVMKNNGYYRLDDILYFGAYPQTMVSETKLISILNNLAGESPTAVYAGSWTSFGCYSEGTNDISYMWYKDVTYKNDKYRGVYFTEYRQYNNLYGNTANNSNQDDNGYTTLTKYWFKYEPIKWRILEEDQGIAFILSEMIIDLQEYCVTNNYEQFDHNGNIGYANNYALSDIRNWLNDNFYNEAFNDLQKELIRLTTVNNGARSANPSDQATKWNGGVNNFSCTDTQDKIFLLSVQEVTTESYGFNKDGDRYDIDRQKYNTDYANCLGATNYLGIGTWWLRSPDYYVATSVFSVDVDASCYYFEECTYLCGVVPALRIKLS